MHLYAMAAVRGHLCTVSSSTWVITCCMNLDDKMYLFVLFIQLSFVIQWGRAGLTGKNCLFSTASLKGQQFGNMHYQTWYDVNKRTKKSILSTWKSKRQYDCLSINLCLVSCPSSNIWIVQLQLVFPYVESWSISNAFQLYLFKCSVNCPNFNIWTTTVDLEC